MDKDPPESQGSGAPGDGGNLWRLLQEDGQLADDGGKPAPPAHPKPFPKQPEDHLADEEMDQWRRYQGDPGGDDDDARASRLRRIIETPEEMAAEGYEVQVARRPDLADGHKPDYDSAVEDYIHEAATIACRVHPDRPSVAQCPECQAFYCQDCLVIRRGRMLCRDCAETAFVVSEDEVLRAQEEGRDAPDVGVAAEAPPEFQLGGFGIEGAPAHPLKKALSWVVDFVITKSLLLLLVWIGAIMSLGFVPTAARAIFGANVHGPMLVRAVQSFGASPLAWLPLALAIDFVYYFLTLSFFNRTIGMGWTGCRIVSEWGEYVSFGAVALRTLVFVALLELPPILISLAFPNYRGPHDLAAGTIVINYSGVKRVDAYETIQLRL